MKSTIVLALGLFATQTVGVHIAANANTDANLEVEYISDCAYGLAGEIIYQHAGYGMT